MTEDQKGQGQRCDRLLFITHQRGYRGREREKGEQKQGKTLGL